MFPLFSQKPSSLAPGFNKLFETILSERRDDDALYKYIELKDELMTHFVDEFLANPDGRQKWEVLPAQKVIQVWKDYAKYRAVRDEEAVNELAFTMARNTAMLEINTEMLGHTQGDPREIWDQNTDVELTPELDDKLGDFVLAPEGQWRISDYGLSKLVTLAVALLSNESAEEKLVDMDRMLQVCHMRGDLAANYIEGGAQTLDTVFDDKERPTGVTPKSLIPDDEEKT